MSGSRELVQSTTTDGYKRVALYHDGTQKRAAVHRLVAIAFIPNPDGKPDVNHIDANKANNHVNNLEWATKSENARHSAAFRGRRRGGVVHEVAELRRELASFREEVLERLPA